MESWEPVLFYISYTAILIERLFLLGFRKQGCRGVKAAHTMLLAYIVAWLALTTLLSRILKSNRAVTVTPLALMIRSPIVFKILDRLRGNRLVALMLDAAILAAFFSMLIYYYGFIESLVSIIKGRGATAVAVPLLPGITIGIETFLYLLPGLSLAVVLHEVFHALASRYEGVEVKSSGFLVVLGLLPAAFVEPDEEMLKSARIRAKLRVYSAGIFANILLFLLIQVIIAAATMPGVYTYITDVAPGSFAQEAGLKPGSLVKYFIVNGTKLVGVENFAGYLYSIRSSYGSLANTTLVVEMVLASGDNITIVKEKAPLNTSDTSKYERIGIMMLDIPAGFAELMPANIAVDFSIILSYAAGINFGLALINAAPLFITDGAHIVRSIVEHYTKSELSARIITLALSILSLLLLLPNLSL